MADIPFVYCLEGWLTILLSTDQNGGYDVRRSKRKAPEGVLIEAELEDDTVQVFTFHELEGYTNIEHLAGRSLIVSLYMHM